MRDGSEKNKKKEFCVKNIVTKMYMVYDFSTNHN